MAQVRGTCCSKWGEDGKGEDDEIFTNDGMKGRACRPIALLGRVG
jgi:hypothetical protein